MSVNKIGYLCPIYTQKKKIATDIAHIHLRIRSYHISRDETGTFFSPPPLALSCLPSPVHEKGRRWHMHLAWHIYAHTQKPRVYVVRRALPPCSSLLTLVSPMHDVSDIFFSSFLSFFSSHITLSFLIRTWGSRKMDHDNLSWTHFKPWLSFFRGSFFFFCLLDWGFEQFFLFLVLPLIKDPPFCPNARSPQIGEQTIFVR